jgi:hypothetical protein
VDRARIDRLAEDGLEYMGTITLGGVVVIGDPLVLGRTPANGAYTATRTASGAWDLLVRADGDEIVELIAVASYAIERFWDLYDEANPIGELPNGALRIALLDGTRKDDEAMRLAMYEPDAEGLPWVTDVGCVIAGVRDEIVGVRAAGEPAEFVSIAFGPMATAMPTVPFAEE